MTELSNASELAQSAIRLDNDINGNPRYYLPIYMLPRMADKARLKAGLNRYRGKRFGAGYVISSYSLEYDLSFVIQTNAA